MTVVYDIVQEVPVQTVVDLYQAGGWWTESPRARQVIPGMIRGSFAFMVAREDDQVIGMGRVISDGCSDGYIQDVVVLREHRKRGIGAQIVKRLAEHCAAAGLGWIGLVAEPGTMPFYERLGFSPLKDYQPMLYRRV